MFILNFYNQDINILRWNVPRVLYQFDKLNNFEIKKESSLPGVEPGIFCSVGRRVIHCATNPVGGLYENYIFILLELRE